jgi:hypothetical protein
MEQQQQRRERAERCSHRHGFQRADISPRDDAVGRAFDIAVEAVVSGVVDRTSGRAHQERAQNEDGEQQRARHAGGGNPKRGQGWPEQQQRADRLVESDQAGVKRQATGGDHGRWGILCPGTTGGLS